MEKINNKVRSEESIKEFLIRKLKSPLFIAGMILVFLFILISIFPQIFTQYTLAQAFQIQPGSWMPPSPEHPLGTTELGRDVLAVIIYSIPTPLILGCGAILFGLGGGVLFGYLAGRFNWKVYNIIMALMIFFYLLPGLVLILIITSIFGENSLLLMLTIGFLLIPSFTQVIANVISRKFDMTQFFKTVICYIPLYFGITILIIEIIGYLGFIDPSFHTLGGLINIARSNLYSAPWASFFPGITIFGMVLSFFILHIGLQDYGPTSRKFKMKFWRTENRSKSLENITE